MDKIAIWELRRIPSRNKKFKYVYMVFNTESAAVIKMHSKREFDACYIVDGRITTDATKAGNATAYAYTFYNLLNQFTRISQLYTL